MFKNLLLVLCLAIFTKGTSQEVSTTFTEYKFLTENYNQQSASEPLDGYTLEPMVERLLGDYNFNFKRLVEKATGKTKAISIVATKIKRKNDKVEYLCMPINNKELSELYYKQVNKLGLTMWQYFETLNKELLASYINKAFNKE